MVDTASSPLDRGSDSPTTATKTCAAAAHDEPFALVGMLTTDASRHATKMAWGGVARRRFPTYRNGGNWARMRDTAALIGMGVMPWEPGGRSAFL